jgi:hypothetical protein
MPNITFDLANFLTTLLSAILGGLISAAISYYFFIKSKPLGVLTSWMANNTGESHVRQALPQFFGLKSTCYIPVERTPSDLDVPHLDKVIVNEIKSNLGRKLEILFRVSDHGMNFQMAAGVAIKDSTGMNHTANNSLFGYMRVDIPILSSQPSGKYKLSFDMVDQPSKGKAPKSFTQTIEVMLT